MEQSGILKLPITGWKEPWKILSYVVQKRSGQISLFIGNSISYVSRVLIVGFGPDCDGWVDMFSTWIPESFCFVPVRFLKLNVIDAFFIGRIPDDLRSRRPRT